MIYPLTFKPILKERVWGGQNLRDLYRKDTPPDRFIGESWEITDRPEGTSVINNGSFAGKDLRWLMENHQGQVLGRTPASQGRFPLLCKILDASEKLSLQVHPPAGVAAQLGGEPKTEIWYVAQARPGCELYVGLRKGVTRNEFERKIADGTVADCFHRVQVKAGDVMFLPSGRVHGLGAGLVIFEIQQNSDTTYRVFDWNRVGPDGRSRDLHIGQSLASIDFNDFEPDLVKAVWHQTGQVRRRPLIRAEPFAVELVVLPGREALRLAGGQMHIIAVVAGSIQLPSRDEPVVLSSGQFSLLPAGLSATQLTSDEPVTLLHVTA